MKQEPFVFSCNGAEFPPEVDPENNRVRYLNYGSNGNERNVILELPKLVRSVHHMEPRVRDLLEIAGYVFAADRLSYRGKKAAVEYHSWSRRLHFYIKVRDYDFWKQPSVQKRLSKALQFVSGDEEYRFSFEPNHATGSASLFDDSRFSIEAAPETNVALFSGGLDSLGGAIYLLSETDGDVFLVSHVPRNSMATTQRGLVEGLKKRFSGRVRHCELRATLHGREAISETQRTRSFLYASIAFAVTNSLGLDRFFLFENGVTGINFRKRQPLMNARASRTSHPQTLANFQHLFAEFAEEKVSVENPFLWKTKSDVVSAIDEYGYPELIPSAVSCGAGRTNFPSGSTHCGRCSQCIDRRFASFATGLESRDSRGLYDFDFVNEALEGRETRLTLRDFVRQAKEYASANADQFYGEQIHELADLVEYLPGFSQQEAVRKVHKLHSRHGRQVQKAIRRIRSVEDDPFEPVPSDSFLEMIERREYLGDWKTASQLKEELGRIEVGREDARKFEEWSENALEMLFGPELSHPKSQVRTHDDREIMDIVFDNAADNGFWQDVKQKHGNSVVIFEAKNMSDLSNREFDQISERLNPHKGLLGVLIARDADENDRQRAIRKIIQHKVILVLTDEDFNEMLDLYQKGEAPVEYMRDLYRTHLERL